MNYYTEINVEKTRQYGIKTLYVVGINPIEEIVNMALAQQITNISFGANGSFDIPDPEQWDNWLPWVKMIKGVLADPTEFWCSLEFNVGYQEGFLETGLAEDSRFIPIVSVKMPYIEQLGYNAILKINDTGFSASNNGIWTHSIHSIMDHKYFTHWQEYNRK